MLSILPSQEDSFGYDSLAHSFCNLLQKNHMFVSIRGMTTPWQEVRNRQEFESKVFGRYLGV